MTSILVHVGFLLLFVGKLQAISRPEDDGVCHTEVCQQQEQQPDRSLIQFRHSLMAKPALGRTTESEDEDEGADEDKKKDKKLKRRFNRIRRRCCSTEMMEFIRGLIEKSGRGVCHEGGLAGITWWYDCKTDKGDGGWEQLKAAIAEDSPSSDPKAPCPWIGKPWVKPGGCPEMTGNCPHFPNATFPPCPDDEDLVCCAPKTDYEPIHENYESDSKIKKFDCSKYTKPVQVYTNKRIGKAYDVSQLKVRGKNSGDYKVLYQIYLNRSKPQMKKQMNSVGINPVDSRSYGTVNVKGTFWIVRFDKKSFEYVARLPPPPYWAGKEGAGGTYFLGAFGQSGTYYVGTSGYVIAVRDIANTKKYPGIYKEWSTKLPMVDKSAEGVTWTHFKGGGADYVVANGDFDQKGPAEWIIKVGSNLKLYIGKIKGKGNVEKMCPTSCYELDQRSKKENVKNLMTSVKVCNSIHGKGSPLCKLAFGAGWNFQDEIFFSRNNGDGVFRVKTDTIDIAKKSYRLRLVGKSEKTNANDGMNCMDVKPPFPGECTWPQIEVDPKVRKNGKNKGKKRCPKNAEPLRKERA